MNLKSGAFAHLPGFAMPVVGENIIDTGSVHLENVVSDGYQCSGDFEVKNLEYLSSDRRTQRGKKTGILEKTIGIYRRIVIIYNT